jgi:epoxyqueuosine reductase
MPISTSERTGAGEIRSTIVERARSEGFDEVGVTDPDAIAISGERLGQFLELGRHGDMDWMARNAGRRSSPRALWPGARSAIVVARNYAPDHDPLDDLKRTDEGVVSVYARSRDYHDVLKGALKRLGQWTAARYGCEIKVFVDTAPLMEKPLAAAAGIGWQGKHTNLVSREFGSWLFLGAMLTTLELAADEPEEDHCGTCRACLDICPTRAFPAPYQLDARRCISYLTIEHKGHIAPEFRAAIGNRVYGCDDCLAVCPWNKFAVAAHEGALAARGELATLALADLAALDDAGFRALFAGTPVKRTGRDRFVRNVMIAAGNSGDPALRPCVEARLGDPSVLVRAMAVWALARLAPSGEVASAARTHLPRERDEAVRGEWHAVLGEADAIA